MITALRILQTIQPALAAEVAPVHDEHMDRTGETSELAETARSRQGPAIVWETQSAPVISAFTSFDTRVISPTPPVDRGAFNPGSRAVARFITRRVRRWATVLSGPTFSQLHGRSPMETTRIARASVSDAADVLGRSADVQWGRGRDACHLLLGPFQAAPKELGRPRVAEAVLHGHGFRRLHVTVAIYRYGNERCGIQIRPRYRRPRTTRRLRHCMQSTHGAADRLRELVLAVDFMPPRQTGPVAIPA